LETPLSYSKAKPPALKVAHPGIQRLTDHRGGGLTHR
jgi:hypothetical protein